jgi:hypothetical protein
MDMTPDTTPDATPDATRDPTPDMTPPPPRGEPRGSEEPGDQLLDRPAHGTSADASSSGRERSMDQQANVAGGRWPAPAGEDEADEDERR